MINNALLLGGGFVGKNMMAKLKSLGNVKTVDMVRREFLDYTQPEKLREYLEKGKPDYLISAAGYTGSPNVEGCETNWQDCYYWNVVVPVRIAKICKEMQIPFINIGSGCIYDSQDKIYSEYDMPNFGIFSNRSSFYSKTKHLCEEKLEDYPVYTFRIRIPYNDSCASKNYLYKLLKYDNLISMKNSITSMNLLSEFTDFFINLKEKPRYGVYNVVNNGIVRGADVIELMREQGLENKNWKILSYEQMNFKVNRSNCMLSPMKIESLGYTPKNVIEDLKENIRGFCHAVKDIQKDTV